MATSLYIIDFASHEDVVFYTKNGKRFKKAANIGLKVFVAEGNLTVKYTVAGEIYDTLFVKDGKRMVDASELDYMSNFWLSTTLLCHITGEHEVQGFDKDGDRFCFDRYIAEGDIKCSKYVLPDGEYDGHVKCGRVIIDTGFVMEEEGYKYKGDAEFFNEFDEDGKPVLSDADKVCPSKEQREIGLAAIRGMLDTLKQNGLSLVIDNENETLCIAKSHDYAYVCDEDEGAIPSHIAFPSTTPAHAYFLSGCTTLKMNDQ